MTDLDKRVEWLRARVPIEDVYLDHVRFIMKHYAEEYHQNKLNNNVALVDVSKCECGETKGLITICDDCCTQLCQAGM